jgi:hypothetical protein
MWEVIERRPDWVAESTRVDSGTDYHYDHWPDLLATLARRLRT